MALIYETENFKLESIDKPFIDRLEGAHVQISPKSEVTDRAKLSSELKEELDEFTTLVGKAIKLGRRKRGVEIGRIDFQDDGDENQKLPVQMYFRAIGATKQRYSKPIVPEYKTEYQPLDDEDIRVIIKEIKKLMKREKSIQEREEREAAFQKKFPGRRLSGYSHMNEQNLPTRQEHRQRA